MIWSWTLASKNIGCCTILFLNTTRCFSKHGKELLSWKSLITDVPFYTDMEYVFKHEGYLAYFAFQSKRITIERAAEDLRTVITTDL